MQTLRKKNSPCKFKKEPTRFLGEGVSFKAKLIGILEVSEARGDQMCQAALADLKMAIRAAGEHKQRIAVQVSIDGLRLRDEKTGECLYHHAVHKISFIAQDRYDSRAFGYIFGSPDTGHRFFGIKTDKAANQVVMAMRDLFQVVFELKKKEMELAKQHIEQNTMKYHSGIFVEPAPDTKGAAGTESCVHRIRPIAETGAGSCSGGSSSGGCGSGADNNNKSLEKKVENRSGVIADLLDLQFELNSLQQGIHQMDKMTPENSRPASEDPFEADPFGDSFTNMKVKDSVQPILPPPPSSAKRCHLERQSTVPTPSSSTCSPATVISNKTPPPPNQTSLQWLENEKEQRFSDGEVSNLTIGMNEGEHKVNDSENGFSETASSSSRTAIARKSSPQIDVFTELDPLGTGLSKPYIDKKDFFQHLKNPPKKVLKDLVITSLSETFPTNFDITESLDPLKVHNDGQNDLFEDGDFANFNNFEEPHDIVIKSQSPQTITNNNNNKSRSIHHQPLSVCLPPEDISSMTSKARGENLIKSDRESNPESIASLIRLPSPKKYQPVRKRDIDGDLPLSCRAPSIDKPFPVDFTLSTDSPASPLRSCSSDANSHLSTSSTELEIVPEPPPRGSGSILINPPPLPPKKLGVRAANKPPPRPPHNNSHFHYDFIEREDSLSASPIRKEHCRKSPEMEIVEEKFDDNFTPISPKFQTNRISHSNFEDSFSSSTMPPTTLSSLFKKSYSSSSEINKKKPSLDITLSQLTSSNLTELATSLDITVAELTNLTLQQLTECLSKLSCKEPQKTPIEDGGGTKEFNQIKENPECETRPNVSSFVVSSNDPLFPVDFDHEIKQPSSEEDSKYDKYAVFRELLALEQIKGDSVRKESIGEEIIINSFSRKESLSLNETTATTADIIECKIDLNIKSNDNDIVESDDSRRIIRDSMNEIEQISKKVEYELDTIHNDSVEFEEEEKDPADESDEKYQSLENLQCEKNHSEMCEISAEAEDDDHETQAQEKKLDEKSSPPPSSSASSIALNDRYAALREIVADMGSINECEEKPKSPLSPENASKSSIAEQDLLKLFSAPSSQLTSPTKTINKDQEPDLKTAASDIFEGIQMLNNSVKTIKLTPTSGFEDVFSPFTEHKTNQHDEDHSKDESNWAKFETGVFNVDKSTYERKGSLGGTSPWSPEDREIQKELSFKSSTQRNSGESDNEWKDEEESEESNGRIRDDGLWTTHSRFDSSGGGGGGGGGGEEGTLYDASDKDRHFRDRSIRKTRGGGGGGGGVLWTKTPHRPRIDSSPWHEETRWEGEHRRYPSRKISYKDEEERKAHWKCRTGQRQPPPLPWNGERDSSFRSSHEHQFYEEDRGKRRMTHWSEEDRDRDRDRFSSQESMGGYDEEERWSIREYERRKWEEEGRFWRGRSSGESDYPTVYRVKPNIHYCRDSPRNRPPIDYPPGWDEEYSLDRSETSPRAYVTRKRHWPKRPNSANEDRNTEVVYTEPRMKYGISRSECSDNDSDMYHHRPYRSRSRESYWESDQEFESWGERLYWSEGPDMKSESLHRRRMNRHKQISRPKPPQSSPFEDDFMQSIEQEHMETAAAVIAENRIRTDITDTKIPLSPQNISEHARKDLLRKHARSSYFEEADFPPPSAATSDTTFSDKQRLGTNLKVIPPDEHSLDDQPKDPASMDSFISDDISGSKDSFFNGDPRFDDDAFVFRSEMADSVSNTSTLPLKNPRQIKYSNNKMKGDHNIKKSESVNIFVRESDPFDDDDFFN